MHLLIVFICILYYLINSSNGTRRYKSASRSHPRDQELPSRKRTSWRSPIANSRKDHHSVWNRLFNHVRLLNEPWDMFAHQNNIISEWFVFELLSIPNHFLHQFYIYLYRKKYPNISWTAAQVRIGGKSLFTFAWTKSFGHSIWYV